MNEKRKKKSINCEKVRFQFCSEGVEWESGITQVHRERVPHGRRVVEPSWTQGLCFGLWEVQLSVQPRGWAHVGTTGESWSRNDGINNRELGHGDICRRGGRFYSSPGPPHPTSATADAWLPTQMIGTIVAVPTWFDLSIWHYFWDNPIQNLPFTTLSPMRHRRSKLLMENDSACTTFYSTSIDMFSLCCTIFEIFHFQNFR